MNNTKAYAAYDATTPLRDFELERREPGPTDVDNEILYCNVCHSNMNQIRYE